MDKKYKDNLKKCCLCLWDQGAYSLSFNLSMSRKLAFTRRVVNVELHKWDRAFSEELACLTLSEKEELADELVRYCLSRRE